MDVDQPFRYVVAQGPTNLSEDWHSTASSRSSQVGPASRRRSSHSGQSSSAHRSQRPMSTIARRPPPLREPITFRDEVPAPPRVFHQPPPLGPYVTPDQRVHPPRIASCGHGPDPGIARHHQSNPHPSLPTPVHRPPKGDNWRRLVHAGNDHHPYARPPDADSRAPNHTNAATTSTRGHIIHPPPSVPQTRVTLPSIHDALSASSMERTWSHASEPAITMTRTYSRSQGGSSGSRPSSHGSSGGNISTSHPSRGQDSPQRKRRTRALMTNLQQSQLKQLWKKTKFPGKPEREELGTLIGLTPRQVQVWFQNQRQKTRKEISDTGVPMDADPRDYDDLDKSPRSRRMSLEAADAASKVQQWSAAQQRLEARSLGVPDHGMGEASHQELRHLIKNPDVRPALPGHRLPPHHYDDRDSHGRRTVASVPTRPAPAPAPTAVPPSTSPWGTGYRSPVPLSPMSHSAMTPVLGTTPSPTQPSFSQRGRTRHPPVPPAAFSTALTEPYRSPIEVSFNSGIPMRQARTIDITPYEAPRRRSNSLEGSKPTRTPSPPDPPSKRSRTHTVTSELPPSLAALALSAPIHESPSHSRQLPKLSPTRPVSDMYMVAPPTLPPPRGRPNERMDGQYRRHTDSTQVVLQRQAHAEARLPGPNNLLRPATDYR